MLGENIGVVYKLRKNMAVRDTFPPKIKRFIIVGASADSLTLTCQISCSITIKGKIKKRYGFYD
nr:hypothetical protein [uncultured Dyadobacter sp.]